MPINIISGSEESGFDGSLSRALNPFTLKFQSASEFPKLAVFRQGSRNYTQSGATALADRQSMGLFDAVILGGFFNTDQDAADPAPNYVSRTQVTQDILDYAASIGNDEIYVFTYVNQIEGTEFQSKIESEDGPNGSDWWFRDASGTRVQSLINITDYTSPDASGYRYAEWYTRNRVFTDLLDVHIAAGITVGKNGINPWYDNLGLKIRKSAVDPDQDGSNNDMQEYFDPENADHVSADPIAVSAVASYRRNQRGALELVSSNYPGVVVGGNTNQYTDVDGTYIIKEYRLDEDDNTTPGFMGVGLSENNTWGPSNFPRSGVWADGTYIGAGNTWSASRDNIGLVSNNPGISDPSIVFAGWEVTCVPTSQLGPGPGGQALWNPVPDSGSSWSTFRWGFATSILVDAHAAINGIRVDSTSADDTAAKWGVCSLFDEMGLINGSVDYGWGSGTTKLFRKWMGNPKEGVPSSPNADGSYTRELDNALVIVNPNNVTTSITVDVSALPGGATEWTRILGTQDSTTNDGTDASADFTLAPADAIILARKSWYDAL